MVQLTLPEYHRKKLEVICNKTGLTKSAVFQRFIEGYNIYEHELLREEKKPGE
jgi:hypothetical protein